MSESTVRAGGSPDFTLDRDPFLETGLPDPLEQRLDELERRTPVRLRAVRRAPEPDTAPRRATSGEKPKRS